MLQPTNPAPPFNVTRASHVALSSRDLARARDFYTEVVGLKVSHETATTIHFRGAEERAHHSLTLRATKKRAECECIGFRIFGEDELDVARAHFGANGARFANVAFQGRTLRVDDAAGTPLEFCARMTTLERSSERTHEQKGAGAQRLNHFQLLVPDVAAAAAFYCDLGFRVSDYSCAGDRVVGALLHRKDDPHDLVLQEGPGPRLHHVAYVVPETHHLIRAIDAAAQLGFAEAVEHGPVRHGHSYRLYLRDSDGHRLALLLPPIQVIDADDGHVRHDVENAEAWGVSPVLYRHATPFTGVAGMLASTERRSLQSGNGRAAGFREADIHYRANEPSVRGRAQEMAR